MLSITSGIRRRTLALVAAGSLASSACTPIAVGSVMVGSVSVLGGAALLASESDDHCSGNDKSELCLVRAGAVMLIILGLLMGGGGALYLHAE